MQHKKWNGTEAFVLLLYFDAIWSLYIHTYYTIMHMCTQ